MKNLSKITLFVIIGWMCLYFGTPFQAQESNILTIGIWSPYSFEFPATSLQNFQNRYPNLEIEFVNFDGEILPPQLGVNTHLDDVRSYINSADVIWVNPYILTPEVVRAGLVLNIQPLIQSDPQILSEDYVNEVWNAFNWDSGQWALPLGAHAYAVLYNPSRFEEVGLALPNSDWTIEDFSDAALELAVYDSNGNVLNPGLLIDRPFGYLLSGSFQQILSNNFDSSLYPQLNTADLLNVLEVWHQLERSGAAAVGSQDSPLSSAPLIITSLENLIQLPEFQAISFASNSLLLEAQGFAINPATPNPVLAFELIRSLSTQVDLLNLLPGIDIPAFRLSSNDELQEAFYPYIGWEHQNIQVLLRNVENSDFESRELHFNEYFDWAVERSRQGESDLLSLLNEVQTAAVDNLEYAAEYEIATTINIATQPPMSSSEEIVLRFGITYFWTSSFQQRAWDDAAVEFSDIDPYVSSTIVEISDGNPEVTANNFDCFYYPGNLLNLVDQETILPVTPLLEADPMFSREMYLPNTLESLSRDNQIFAIPIHLYPVGLRYDPNVLVNLDIAFPPLDWSTTEFNQLLFTIHNELDEQAAYSGLNVVDEDSTYLLMLIASYGGLPFDFSTYPPTVALTNTSNIDAIQTVFDLFRDGLITETGSAPIYNYLVGDADYTNASPNTRVIINYPPSEQYHPYAFKIGAVYLSSRSQNPNACYRWASFISTRYELFTAMPATYGYLDDQNFINSIDNNQLEFYREYASSILHDNSVFIPVGIGGWSDSSPTRYLLSWFETLRLNYLENNSNLVVDLNNLEQRIYRYYGCLGNDFGRDNVSLCGEQTEP